MPLFPFQLIFNQALLSNYVVLNNFSVSMKEIVFLVVQELIKRLPIIPMENNFIMLFLILEMI